MILRRLLDLFYTPQRALVFVDGQYVGVWAYTDHGTEYAPARFADNTDFFIPLRFTHGKTGIDITLCIEDRDPLHPTKQRIDYNVLQGFAWTSFHYWIYSIGT